MELLFHNHTSNALLNGGENQESYWGLKILRYADETSYVKGSAQVLGLTEIKLSMFPFS